MNGGPQVFRWSSLVILALTLACAAPTDQIQYNLVDLFPFAEHLREVGKTDFDSERTPELLVNGWSHGNPKQRLDVGSYLVNSGRQSRLTVFLSKPRPLRLTFRCKLLSQTSQKETSIGVTINGMDVKRVRVTPVLREYTLEVGSELWVAGSNLIQFKYPTGSASQIGWDYLRLRGVQEVQAPRPGPTSDEPSIILPFGTQINYYARLPASSTLSVEEIRLWGRGSKEAMGVSLDVETRTSGKPGKLFRTTLSPSPRLQRIQFEDDSQGLVKIGLRAPLPENHERFDWRGKGIELVRPRISAPSGWTADNLGGQSSTSRDLKPTPASLPPEKREGRVLARNRPNVIIYLIDTLRADHLETYGYGRNTSPRIDEFASDSVVFEAAMAQSSWTRSAVASLFTGLYAQTHGVNNRTDALPASLPVLAELLREAGYTTAGIITNGNISQGVGFDRGFDYFEYLKEEKSRDVHVLSDRLNDSVFDWLANHSNEAPFFLYLHSTDPHDPYTPRKAFRQQVQKESPTAISTLQPFAPRPPFVRSDIPPGPEKLRTRDLIDLYDAEIAFNDNSFGHLLDELKTLGLYDDSLIVLLSDHGEGFGDHHGHWKHGNSLYEELLHVPLVVKFPQQTGAGKRIPDVVRQIDLMPTILESAEVDADLDLHGHSLRRTMASNPHDRATSYTLSYLDLDQNRISAVRHGFHKLIKYHRTGLQKLIDTELYDHQEDSRERKNLSQSFPVERGYLESLLRVPEILWSKKEAEEAEFPEEVVERLKALGYLE